jgi:Ca2+-binding RTX toxin-like protein
MYRLISTDVLNGGEGFDIMAGGIGNDTFICDLDNKIISDFNSAEGDKKIGQRSVVGQALAEQKI